MIRLSDLPALVCFAFVLGSFAVARAGAPPNDSFGAAIDLGAVAEVEVDVDLRDATRQFGEPSHDRNGYSPTAWWSWTAPVRGLVTGEVLTSGARLGVHVGDTLDALTEIETAGAGSSFRFVAEQGQVYRIALADDDLASFVFRITETPANDAFAEAADLGGGAEGSVVAGFAGFTREESEPEPNSTTARGGSAWWKWTAPADGRIDLFLGGFPGFTVIHAGQALDALEKRLEVQNYSDERVAVSVRAGETVYLQVIGGLEDTQGVLSFRWLFDPTSGNHSADFALDLGSGGDERFGGVPAGATSLAEGEFLLPDQERWWAWTAPTSGVVGVERLIEPDGFSLRSYGKAEDGSLKLMAVARHPTTPVEAGETIYFNLLVFGNGSAADTSRYRLRFFPGPANDAIGEAVDLGNSSSGRISGDGGFATPQRELDEQYDDRSIWWRWTAPGDGELQLAGLGSVDASLYRFDGAELMRADGVGSIQGGRWKVTAGETYHLAILGWSAFAADYEFVPARTGNDRYVDAVDLGSTGYVEVLADNRAAGREPGEPGTMEATLWWSWTAPLTGSLVVRINGDGGAANDEVYTGDVLETLVPVGHFVVRVLAGTTYHIATGSDSLADVGRFHLELTLRPDFPPPPANDHFANAIDLGSDTFVRVSYSLDGSTVEPGEPFSLPGRTGSAWWKWRAPFDGLLHLPPRFGNATPLFLFSGSGLADLELIGEPPSPVPVHGGGDYWICAALGWGTIAGHYDELRLFVQPGLPPGSEFATALPLESAWNVRGEADRSGAGTEAGEPPLSQVDDYSMWWRWTAPADGFVRVVSDWSSGIYMGGSLAELVEAPRGARPFESYYEVMNGRDYFIRLSGDGLESGLVSFSLAGEPTPASAVNDDFEGALDLGSVPHTRVTGTTFGSSVQAGEMHDVSPSATESVWYRWSAPAGGELAIDRVSGSISDLLVYQGNSIEALQKVASLAQTSLRTAVRAGGDFWIAVVVAPGGDPGPFAFALTFSEGPPNDFVENALDLGTVESVDFAVNNAGATIDSEEPDDLIASSLVGSVWWRWRAPRDGVAYLHYRGPGGRSGLFLYRDSLEPVSGVATSLRSSYDGLAFRVRAGETYTFALASDRRYRGELNGFLLLSQRPPNDDFANRAELLPGDAVRGTLVGATLEESELDHGVTSVEKHATRWWTFTPEVTAPVRLMLETGLSSGTAAVYTGNTLSVLDPVASVTGNRSVIWTAQEGVAYHIALTAIRDPNREFVLSLDLPPAPSNDDLASAEELGSETGRIVTGSNVLATAEEDEPSHAGYHAARSLWYGWSAPADGFYQVVANDPGGVMVVGVYRMDGGGMADLVEVTGGVGRAGFQAGAGDRYLIAIDVRNPIVIGSDRVEFRIGGVTPLSNDDFADRIRIDSVRQPYNASSLFATLEDGEDEMSPRGIHGTRWWEWTARSRGTAYLHFREGRADILAYVADLSDPELSDLRPVGTSYIQNFQTIEGQTYYLQVGTRQAGVEVSAWFELQTSGFRSGPAPENDDFARRLSLSSRVPLAFGGNLGGATLEPGEGGPARFDGSVWWSWTAPTGGSHEIRVLGSRIERLVVATGSAWPDLDLVGEDSQRVVFQAVAGTEYHIAVYGYSYSREIGLEIVTGPPPPPNDDFVDRLDLGSEARVEFQAETLGATSEADEPAHHGVPAERTVWWTWTAPLDDVYRISGATGSRLGVYEGNAPGLLVPVTSGVTEVTFAAAAGRVYQIALDSAVTGLLDLALQPVSSIPVAGNGTFGQAEVVTGALVTLRATNRGAVLENGEPWHGGDSTLAGSVWWSWTPVADGPVTVSVEGASSMRIGVYTGSRLDALVPVGSQRFFAEAGTTYLVAVAGGSPSTVSDFDLRIDQTIVPPANDNLGNAQPVAGVAWSIAGTTIEASIEPGEPRHVAESWKDPGHSSVWYSWTAPEAGHYRFTESSGSSAYIALYTGDSLPELLLVASGRGAVEVFLAGGTEFKVAVAMESAPSDITLALERTALPANDRFQDRSYLGSGGDVQARGTTRGATREDGEPIHNNDPSPGESIWWTWTAECSGDVFLDFAGSEETPVTAVYVGGTLEELVEIASDERPVISFTASAGVTYAIAVAARGVNSGGQIELRIRTGAPANDDFDEREVLTGELPVVVMGSNAGATAEGGETGSSGQVAHHSVWWEWRAAADGWVEIDPAGTFSGARVDVQVGGRFPLLDPVASGSSSELIRFFAQAGERYFLRVAGSSNLWMGTIEFELRNAMVTAANDDYFAALALTGGVVSGNAHSAGAGTQPGEPAPLSRSRSHLRSLWWRWTAPRDGVVRIISDGGEPFLYEGEWPALRETAFVPGEPGTYLVRGGISYSLAMISDVAQAVQFDLRLGPAEDLVGGACFLGAVYHAVQMGSLRDASHEPLEPFHDGRAPVRSMWYRWTAPASGAVDVRVLGDNDSELRLGVYTGSGFSDLSPHSAGAGSLRFDATGGQRYLIAVDDDPFDPVALDFTLRVDLAASPYSDWRNLFFAANDPQGDPLADPDLDGRCNLFERAFATHPLLIDPGEIPFTVEPRSGSVVLSVVRPVGMTGMRYSFEVSRALDEGWEWTGRLSRLQWTVDRGDGTETFFVQLNDFDPRSEPEFFARLRVELGEDPLD